MDWFLYDRDQLHERLNSTRHLFVSQDACHVTKYIVISNGVL